MSRLYMVRIRRAGQVVRQFEAMSSDSVSCVQQHMDLCEPGEKLDVMGLAEYRESQRERKALELQINRPSELERAITGVTA